MRECLIVTGGVVNMTFAGAFIKKNMFDIIIAADAGLASLDALGIIPDIIVGDLDTVDPAIVNSYRTIKSVKWELHKPEKDETDTELAINTAISMSADSIILLGATGGRLDHEIGNIQLMYSCLKKGIRMCIYDEKNKLYMINKKYVFNKNKLFGKYVSFLPVSETVKDVTLSGFKYPLDKKDIYIGTSLCVSNELIAQTGSIDFSSGIILCVEAHD